MPRARSYSRRRIRALADNVPIEQATEAPLPVYWTKRALNMGIDVVLPSAFYSPDYHKPTDPNDPAVQAVVDRVCGILTELDSGVPYGRCFGMSTGIFWQSWVKTRSGARKLEEDWWGTTQHAKCKPLVDETGSALRDMLRSGLNAEVKQPQHARSRSPRWKKKGSVQWLKIVCLSVRWMVLPPKKRKKPGKPAKKKAPAQPKKSAAKRTGKKPAKQPSTGKKRGSKKPPV